MSGLLRLTNRVSQAYNRKVKRPYSIAIRLNRVEYQAIKRHARKRQEPPSTWAREALMETLGMIPSRAAGRPGIRP